MLRIIAILVLAISSSAQILLPILAGKTAATTYTGPGDVVSGADAWYGLRAYSAAKRGNAAANVCDASDVHCVDALTDATTGNLIIPTSNPNCTGSACTIKTLYDQTQALNCGPGGGSNCDVTQATIAKRPTLTVNCIGSLPCMTWGTGTVLVCPNNTNFSTYPNTASTVAERTSNFTSYQTVTGDGITGNVQMVFNNTANTFLLYAGNLTVTGTASDSAFHAIQGLFNGASSKLYIDGTQTTGDAGSAPISFQQYIVGGNGANDFLGLSVEAGWWHSDQSALFSSLNSNQHSYWGF